MSAPIVEETTTEQPAESAPVEEPKTPQESDLSDYWRGELTRARNEAGGYRTQLREAQDALKEAKTKEEFDAAVAELNTKISNMEVATARAEAARKFNLPDALVARLQGSTAEELEADAKALSELVQIPTPAKPERLGGGLSPATGTGEGKYDPRALADEVLKNSQSLFS